jgi:MFS family permease
MASDAKPLNRPSLWTKEFILITVVNLFIFLGFQMLLPVLPVYSAKLGGANVWAGLVVGMITFSAVIMRPIAGRLLDQKGRKGVLLYGLGVFILCTLGYNWVPSVLLLLVLRFIHGFGWGASGTATSTIASDLIPKHRFAEGMGYFGLTSTLAMAIGPALGLSLMNGYGFNTVFNLAAASVMIAVLIVFTLPTQTPILKPNQKKGGMIERSALLPGFIIFFINMSYGAVVSFIALYAEQREVQHIGLFFTVYALAILVSRPYFGRIADRKGTSFALIPGIGALLGALVILYVANSLTIFLLAGLLYGFGFGAVQPSLQAMAVRNVEPARRGSANATFFLGFDLGIGVGSIVWGVVAERVGYNVMYLWAMVPVFIALLIHFRRSTRDLNP